MSVVSPPAAPWTCTVKSVIWLHKATSASRSAVVGLEALPRAPVTAAALNTYTDTPVGPYHEIVIVPSVLFGPYPQGHVPFIAVDDERSAIAGWQNWALPKVNASFLFAARGSDGACAEIEGPGWVVSVDYREHPLRLPLLALLSCRQVWPDGLDRSFVVKMRGRTWPLTVNVSDNVADRSRHCSHQGATWDWRSLAGRGSASHAPELSDLDRAARPQETGRWHWRGAWCRWARTEPARGMCCPVMES